MLLNMDCFGVHAEPVDQTVAATQHFMTADLNRAIHVHHTSLGFDDDSRIFGRSQGKLVMVADGLGDSARGRRASTVAVDAVAQYLLNTLQITDQARAGDEMLESSLKAALQHCQKTLQREGGVIGAHQGMGTEITVAYVCWPSLYVVQAGKIHCSLWRDGNLTEVTGTGASEIVGGPQHDLAPGFIQQELRLGDKLVLGSRSLHRALSNFEIASVLNNQKPAADLCQTLVEAASAIHKKEHTAIVAIFDEGVPVDPQTTFAVKGTSQAVQAT